MGQLEDKGGGNVKWMNAAVIWRFLYETLEFYCLKVMKKLSTKYK